EAHSESTHSRAETTPRDAQGTPSQSAARDSNIQGTAASPGTVSLQGTAASQGPDSLQGTAAIPKSPNDYTPTDASQTSGGDEGLLDIYALNREVKRLKRQTLSQAKQIIKLKAKLKTLSKFVQPVVQHHAFWVENQHLKKQKRRRKKHKKKVSSVKLGRNKDEGTRTLCSRERKSERTEEINIEEKKASDVKSGDTEELDLETFQSTARQSTVTPRTLNFDDEAAEWMQRRKRKRLEELKKAKPKTTSLAQERNQMMNFLKGQGYKNLQKLRYPQMKELYDRVQESIKDSFKDFIPMGSEKEREMLKEREAKRLLRKRKATISEEQPSKKLKLRTETVDEIRNYLRIVDFEKSAQDKESLEGISMITELQVIDSPDGEYLIIHRANNHFRAFDTLFRFDTSRSAYTRVREMATDESMRLREGFPLSREL
ncbi:hypothetical protein Tco_1052217, partial [Tanacetum coccineum]